jgi:hypothetical protein
VDPSSASIVLTAAQPFANQTKTENWEKIESFIDELGGLSLF